jgi:hypothetical protein
MYEEAFIKLPGVSKNIITVCVLSKIAVFEAVFNLFPADFNPLFE